jgi:hypothetical protein
MLAARDRLLSTVEGRCRAARGRVKPPRHTDCPRFKEGGRAASGSKVATGDKVLCMDMVFRHALFLS